MAFLATTGVILSAAYALYVYRRIIYGALVKPALKNIQDVSYREIGILAPLVALTIFFGLYPAPILDVTAVSVKKLVASYEAAVRPRQAAPRTGARVARSRHRRRRRQHPSRGSAACNELSIYAPMLPEIALALGAMAILMFGVFQKESAPGADFASGWLAVVVLVIAAGLVVYRGDAREVLFEGAFISDAFSRFAKLLVLAGAALVLVMSFDSLARAKLLTAEFCVLTLLAVTGMLLMISAGNLIALFLGLELQSLALYVIAAIDRDQVRSSEAGLKYFVLGSLSSGMLLYGASLIYGFTGSIDLAVIATVAQGQTGAQNIGLIVGLVFLLVGLAFKVGAVPFHMWTPDVYEGAPTPVTAFFAAAPKLAAMALLVRTLLQGFPGIAAQWQQIIVFLSIASMLLGAFAAIGQRNIKRLMAYSSIGHIGYALIGLAANSEAGTQSVLVYLAIYLAMTVGTFACILSMRTAEGPVEDIDSLAGLAKTNLSMAFVLAMLLFSMAGIPAARRLLRQVVRVRRGDESRPHHARRHRRAGERRRRLLLPARSSRSCSSTRPRRRSCPSIAAPASSWRCRAPSCCCTCWCRRRSSMRR